MENSEMKSQGTKRPAGASANVTRAAIIVAIRVALIGALLAVLWQKHVLSPNQPSDEPNTLRTEQPPADANEQAKTPDQSPAPARIAGTVKEKAVVNGITWVTISVGSADGVQKGMVFYVEDPQTPKYLGKVTIDAVDINESIGRLDGDPDGMAAVHVDSKVENMISPVDPNADELRIVFLASYSSSKDVEPPKLKMDEIDGKQAAAPVPIAHPYGVAMWKGKIYVCDTRNPDVEILDLHKHQMLLMGAGDLGKLAKPVAIAIADDGTKYVADIQLSSIVVFDAADHYVRSFGQKDLFPGALAIHGKELYVADFKASHIEAFDRIDGTPLRTIGALGKKPGQMAGPVGVANDSQGNVYADDIIKCRVQKFSSDGKLLGAFGGSGDSPGAFTRPKDLAVDGDGNIYVVDAAFNNVQVFDKQFHPLLFFGSAGNHPGAMDLPAGISIHEGDLDLFADKIPDAFLAQRLILVTNQSGKHSVSVYAVGHLKPGHTVKELSDNENVMSTGAGATTQPAAGPDASPPEPKP